MIKIDDNKLVQMICDYIIKDGTENTDSGNWIYYANELAKEFMVPEWWVSNNSDKIMECLYIRKEVADVERVWDGDFNFHEFDVTFYTAYCPNVEDDSDTSDMVNQYYFAESRWTVDDVIDAAKENDIKLTPKQAEEWWTKNEKSFRESLIAFGNQMLADADFSEV